MEVLQINNISKSYGGVKALDNINFAINQGDRVAIIGPNGAGKTTLLKIISGQIAPTTGHIILFNNDITKMASHKRVNQGLSQSFQITSLFMNLTVLENILIAIKGKKSSIPNFINSIYSDSQLLERAKILLESWDMWASRQDRVSNISYGDQRKLEIILSLASDPKLLLLDEPNSGLTKSESDEIIKKLDQHSKGLTLLLVAHDIDLVFQIALRIIVLFNGEIIADGNPQEIQSNNIVQEIYLTQTKNEK